jgi:hypothetical protein
MNPAAQTLNAPSSLVQDVKPPPQPAASSSTAPIKAEVVSAIPVKAPAAAGPQLTAAPVINPLTANTTGSNPVASKDLDKILKEVNKDVKKIDQPKLAHFSLASIKSANLIMPVIAAVLVAAILIAASVLAFRPPAEHVRTRATAQTGT